MRLTRLAHAAGIAALSTSVPTLASALRASSHQPSQAPHGLASPSAASPTPAATAHLPDEHDDPHLWLEEIEGDAPLAWCRQQNARVMAAVGNPEESDAYRQILAIADSKEKIPYVGRIGGSTGDETAPVYYNFWQDADNKRGLWRRTSLGSYRDVPEWEDVLSLDSLNAHEARLEGQEWVWHGYDVLYEGPGKSCWDRVLVFLSPGGTDAQVAREFDLGTKSFVTGGFETTVAAKCDVAFRTRDEVQPRLSLGSAQAQLRRSPDPAQAQPPTPPTLTLSYPRPAPRPPRAQLLSGPTADATPPPTTHPPRRFSSALTSSVTALASPRLATRGSSSRGGAARRWPKRPPSSRCAPLPCQTPTHSIHTRSTHMRTLRVRVA